MLLAAALLAGPALAQVRGELTRAVHSDCALWLLDDAGKLRRLPDGANDYDYVPLSGSAVGLCRRGGAPVVAAISEGRIVVQQRTGARWRPLGSVPLGEGERPVALHCDGGAPVVLTSQAVTVLGRAPQPLGGELPRSIRYVTYRDGPSLLVGTNMGEWGGGLVRIALANGAVTRIAGVNLPVHDIVASPYRRGCVLVAEGLVHFGAVGQLGQVCGSATQQFAVVSMPRQLPKPPAPPSFDMDRSVAFFAFAAGARGLEVIGQDGIRPVRRDGLSPVRPLPPRIERGGEYVADASPRYLLVMTGINNRASLGGGMPLVAPR